jgi:tetratricopeptide (TPR) repeat protein
MRRINHQRLLPAMLSVAAFIASPVAFSAQQAKLDSAAPAAVQPSPVAGDSPVPPENVGDAMFFHQRYEKAIEAYKKASKDSSEVWNKMGIAYEMLLDLKDAGRCFKESLRLNAHDDRVWNNLGTVYDAMKDHGRAEREYRKALKLNPSSAVAWRNLGTNMIFQDNFDDGQEMYRRALSLDPDVFDGVDVPATSSIASAQQLGAMNYSKAKGYAQAGKIDRAIQSLRRALSEGFTSADKVAQDSSFAPLHGAPAYERLMAEEEQGQ